jgi:hypothetical protein
MSGFDIIEVILGLTFVYLLLSLLCTAINEYIAGLLNKRGRYLFRAVDDLLGSEEVQEAFYQHPLITTLSPHHGELRRRAKELEGRLYGTRWARRLMGWMRPTIRRQRYPSYLPARNFSLALLNSTDYTAELQGTNASPPASPPAGGQVAATPNDLARLFDALLQESSADVSELLRDPAVATILASPVVPQAVRDALTDVTTGTQREVQKLQNAVEVWFNNAMDRVSGTYKRYTQVALLLIGLVVAILLNADTIRIWRTLSGNDQLREAVVRQAIAFSEAHAAAAPADSGQAGSPATAALATDSTRVDSTATTQTTAAPATGAAATPTGTAAEDSADCSIPTGAAAETAYQKAIEGKRLTCGEARAVIAMARAELDSTQLAVGWTRAELLELGVAREVPAESASAKRDSTRAGTARQRVATGDTARRDTVTRAAASRQAAGNEVEWQGPWHWRRAIWPKLLGLLLTAIAVSLGAPFWFDVLNKIINLRSAGRAPDERPKNPEAAGKRMAEVSPK